MNQTHVHLLINHLPVFGSIIGGFVLAHGIWTKSYQTKIAAYIVLISSAFGGGIAYLTGEAAEESVENIKGISKTLIDQHEDLAVISFVAILILGVASFLGLLVTIKKSTLSRSFALVIFFLSLISFGLLARTGYIGGQIRHTEINQANQDSNLDGAKDGDD